MRARCGTTGAYPSNGADPRANVAINDDPATVERPRADFGPNVLEPTVEQIIHCELAGRVIAA